MYRAINFQDFYREVVRLEAGHCAFGALSVGLEFLWNSCERAVEQVAGDSDESVS